MTSDLNNLKKWLNDLSSLIEDNKEPSPKEYAPFLQKPELALDVIELFASLKNEEIDDKEANFSAFVFVIEICLAQLQAAKENGSKRAERILENLMSIITQAIIKSEHRLNFWLPILNAFYEVHVELSEELMQAYLELANQNDEDLPEETDHLNTIREMIAELSDLSVFDIAEHFFAQSYAMPADFFVDLILDLYSIVEGQDIALLILLHPKKEVREVVLSTFDHIMNKVRLTSISLSRLQIIKGWYPQSEHEKFNRWIKLQRKKGVVFSQEQLKPKIRIKASEIDGSGAQGIFIHVKQGRKNRLCGMLVKWEQGIKDAWITSAITAKEVVRYYDEAFDESISLREVNVDYLMLMIGHFLALTISENMVPNLHLLEIQELLGLNFHKELIDLPYLMEQLSIQITPFTLETMQNAFQRSKKWLQTKPFTNSWYVENASVDKLVNRYCTFVEGAKICNLDEAMKSVFANEFEKQREKWLFHFLWTTLWLKSKARKNEKTSQDCFFIAYAIHTGYPLASIPIMQEICQQTVLNSIETMQDRRTYLNKE